MASSSFIQAATITAATQAEMEAGTQSAARSMSPLGVEQAIAAAPLFNDIVQPAGKIHSIASGTNQRAGNAVLISGVKTVNNTTVTANTIVMLTRKTSGGTIGTAITYTLSAGASFTITSDNILDTSTFSYMLIECP